MSEDWDDRLDRRIGRMAGDLAAVRWPSPQRIRARARRRTLRAVVAAPLAVLLVLAGGWGAWSALGGGDRAAPPIAPPATASVPAPVSASPAVAWFPPSAVLQPGDVGPDQRVTGEQTYEAGEHPVWHFNVGCGGEPKATTWERYLFMRQYTVVPEEVWIEAQRYTTADARQILADARRVVVACDGLHTGTEASSAEHPAHGEMGWTLLRENFAGDESLLIRQTVTSVDDLTGEQVGEILVVNHAVVRVGDLVTILMIETENPALLEELGRKAAARLCLAATPRC